MTCRRQPCRYNHTQRNSTGRPPTSNLNPPPQMRARTRGEHVYDYFDPGAKPRRERRWERTTSWRARNMWSLPFRSGSPSGVNFGAELQHCLVEIVPTLSANTQHTHRSGTCQRNRKIRVVRPSSEDGDSIDERGEQGQATSQDTRASRPRSATSSGAETSFRPTK